MIGPEIGPSHGPQCFSVCFASLCFAFTWLGMGTCVCESVFLGGPFLGLWPKKSGGTRVCVCVYRYMYIYGIWGPILVPVWAQYGPIYGPMMAPTWAQTWAHHGPNYTQTWIIFRYQMLTQFRRDFWTNVFPITVYSIYLLLADY